MTDHANELRHKAADCNNLRDYELLRALSIEVAKAPEVKP